DLERLPSAAALGLYTHEAGAALGEAEIGSLEPGAFADFVVLDSDDWPAALRQGAASVVATYRGGHPTFERDPAP
ncbi:MAG: amidohydrolase family protein, partial [Thermoplasmata archaeon]|nr:amidohydrolase family protein [Thermoplasmata archaeon]